MRALHPDVYIRLKDESVTTGRGLIGSIAVPSGGTIPIVGINYRFAQNLLELYNPGTYLWYPFYMSGLPYEEQISLESPLA